MPDSGHINYIRNPKGNFGPHCVTSTGISLLLPEVVEVKTYPNPFISQTIIEISSSEKPENAELKVFVVVGQEIIGSNFGKNNHGYEPQGKPMDLNSAAEQRGIIPSAFGGIVRLTNFLSLRFKNLSLTNKIIIGRNKLNSGIYFYQVFQKEKVIAKGKMVAE